VFRRKSTDDAVALTTETDASPQGKGRPTPTRKEAEAARKAALVGTSDPKAAKKAERDAARLARYEAQQGLRSGDPKKLPARDQGPVKALVRDLVDGRISMGEIFIPVAVLVLVLGFVRVQIVQVVLLWVWLFVLLGVVVDSLFLAWRLRKLLPREFPDADPKVSIGHDARGGIVYGLKGATLYAIVRSLQLRFLRLPKPRLRWNGQPVVPKQPKPTKG
jgi:hypothetical protein